MYDYSLSNIFCQLSKKNILTRYVFDCSENEKLQMTLKNSNSESYISPRVTEETIQELIFEGSAVITFDISGDSVDCQRMNYFIVRRIFIKAGYHIRENPHNSLCVVVSRESIPFQWPPNDKGRTFSLPSEENNSTHNNSTHNNSTHNNSTHNNSTHNNSKTNDQKVEKKEKSKPTKKIDKRFKNRVVPEDFKSYLMKFNKTFLLNQLALNSIKNNPQKNKKIHLVSTLCDFYAENVRKGITFILPK